MSKYISDKDHNKRDSPTKKTKQKKQQQQKTNCDFTNNIMNTMMFSF